MKKKDILNKNIGTESSTKEYVKNIVAPIFLKVLNEKNSNHMMGGPGVDKIKDFSLYQPHNYRVYFDFDKTSFGPPKNGRTDLLGSVLSSCVYSLKNSGSEHFFKNFFDCNITVKKFQVEVLCKIDHKRWYVVEHGSDVPYELQIENIIKGLDSKIVGVFKKFISLFGGVSNFKILNHRVENKVKLESSIDNVDLKYHFHSGSVKKVYNESNVEFDSVLGTISFFENRAIERIAPEINVELSNLHSLLFSKLDGLAFLKKNFGGLNDLFTYEKVIIALSDEDKFRFVHWLGEKFG